MTLRTLELLDSSIEVASWLERQLVGDDLSSIVSELSGWRAGSDEAASLEKSLEGQLTRILESGLTDSDARILLQAPRLLLPLQEQICFLGGPYWQNLSLADGEKETLPPARTPVLKFLEQSGSPHDEPGHPASLERAKTVTPPKRGIAGWSLMLMALVILVGLGSLLFNQQFMNDGRPVIASDEWGLNDLQKFRQIASGADYLDAVAMAFDDWNKQPPADASAGAKRIGELIRGCQNLIADEQMGRSPLDPDTRKWLHGKCSAWIEKFREDLATLDQDPATWPDVSSRMSAKIEKAIMAMRDQSSKLRKSA